MGVVMFRYLTVLMAVALSFACSGERQSPSVSESAAGAAGAVADTLDSGEPVSDPANRATAALLRNLADRNEALIEMSRLAMIRREPLRVSAAARSLLTEARRESNHLVGSLRAEFRVTYRPAIPDTLQTVIDSLNGAGQGQFDELFERIVATHLERDTALIEAALPSINVPAVSGMLAELRERHAGHAKTLRKSSDASPR